MNKRWVSHRLTLYVDRGYRGHDPVLKGKVIKDGQKRLPTKLKRELKRRSVVEAVIGRMKNDGHLGRNYLKGRAGDKMNALLSAIGHNLRLLIKWIGLLFSLLPLAHLKPHPPFLAAIPLANPFLTGDL